MYFQSKDRTKLNDTKEKLFVESCLHEFIEESVIDSNRRKIRNLTTWSYLPNVISIATAAFFILYLMESYSLFVRVFLVTLLLIVAASIEYGKRALINETGKTYFLTDKLPSGLFAGVVVLTLISMTVSFIGGNKLVTETAQPPEKVVNPKIDSLNTLLAGELATIESLRKTTWKGKITRDANRGINQSKTIQSALLAQISELEAHDNDVHEAELADNTNKVQYFGYVLGSIAILADLLLFLVLWTVKKLKHEIVLLNIPTPTPSASTRKTQPTSMGFSQNSIQPTQSAPGRTMMGFNKIPRNDHAMRDTNEPTKKIKVCLHCGNDFEMKTTWQKYCSEDCRKTAYEIRTGKKLKI
jgi:hypothetical protein